MNSISSPRIVTQLRHEADLRYRVHVLLCDLSNVGSDPQSETRLSSTANELYISEPYFSESESLRIRASLIEDTNEAESDNGPGSRTQPVSVEGAIQSGLAGFLDKRRASGDARPCGPHDMVPIYGEVFGIQEAELKDERFSSRLRRSGLGDSHLKENFTQDGGSGTGKSQKTRGKKGK